MGAGLNSTGEGFRRVKSSMEPYPYGVPEPRPPQPTGGEGGVNLEEVNVALMAAVRKARAAKAAKMAAAAQVPGNMKGKDELLENSELEIELEEETIPSPPTPPRSRRVDAIRGDEGVSWLAVSNQHKRESYPNTNYNHRYGPLNHSKSQPTLSRSCGTALPIRSASPSTQALHQQPSNAVSPSPWTLLNTAHTRILFSPTSISPSSSSPPTSPTQNLVLRRRSNDRPDWSESDESGLGQSGGGLGVTAGMKVLLKKSESVLRRAGRKKGEHLRRRSLSRSVSEGVCGSGSGSGGNAVQERAVVMRMKNDSVISREVGVSTGGWRCGCFMR